MTRITPSWIVAIALTGKHRKNKFYIKNLRFALSFFELSCKKNCFSQKVIKENNK